MKNNKNIKKPAQTLEITAFHGQNAGFMIIGVTRFELAISRPPDERFTRLSHTPICTCQVRFPNTRYDDTVVTKRILRLCSDSLSVQVLLARSSIIPLYHTAASLRKSQIFFVQGLRPINFSVNQNPSQLLFLLTFKIDAAHCQRTYYTTGMRVWEE